MAGNAARAAVNGVADNAAPILAFTAGAFIGKTMSDYFKDNKESKTFDENDKELYDQIVSIYRSHFPDQDIPSYWVLNGKGGPTKTMPSPVNIEADVESYINGNRHI